LLWAKSLHKSHKILYKSLSTKLYWSWTDRDIDNIIRLCIRARAFSIV
jgi:hypothetical protein